MTRRVWTGGLTVADGILLAGLAGASPHSEKAGTALDVAQSVRRGLFGLPCCGVFDLLTYQVSDKGLVTPGGYVYHTPLKASSR